MKNYLLVIFALLAFQISHAQKNGMNSTRFSFGLAVDILDQHTPDQDGFQMFQAPMDFGIRGFTWINVNPSLAVSLSGGSNAIRGREIEDPFEEKNLHMLNIDAGLVYKFNNGYILKETSPVSPFLFVKGRASFSQLQKGLATGTRWGFGVPIGGGINWGFSDGVALQTAASYTFGITSEFDNDVIFSLGLLFDLGESTRVKIEPEPEPPADTDNDGIIDDNDDCPEVPGLAEFDGCPDTDGDGIMDSEDECPTEAGLAAFSGCPDRDDDGVRDLDDACPDVPGLARLNGCPIPDTDNDGVNDEEDECPEVPGLPALNGCPDTDGDGLRDSDDSCPTEAGPISNKGCPEVEEEVIKKLEFAATNIQFETGSAVIKTKSFPILNEVVEILKEWKNYSVKVAGHTDSVGSEESNQALSEKRAQSAAAYLVSKGIVQERVSSEGFGESLPKADNNTAAGRAQNRRVEFNLFIP